MELVVQKYGGTSVGDTERIKAVAQRIQKTVRTGRQVVVVVSAMGKSTDRLVSLAQDISANPSRREMDMLLSTGEQVSIALLSMALQELGQAAISLTGAQVGIVTEAAHSHARILEIKTERIQKHLERGEVVVVAGFQGITASSELEFTTLGRGGSDTSAVALAVALQAARCEICTDVPGILTTDPRLVPDAQLMAEVTADEMLELASLGAKVLHPRAVEIARNFGMPLTVCSSWTNDPGPAVVSLPTQEAGAQTAALELSKAVDAIEFDDLQAKVALLRIPDQPGVASQLFGTIAEQNVDVDLIVQSIHQGNLNDIAFSVAKSDILRAHAIAEGFCARFGGNPAEEVEVDERIAIVAIAGAGIIGRPGIAAQMFTTLGDADINIKMISTSEVKVSCVIDQHDLDKALKVLAETFATPLKSPLANPEAKFPAVRGAALDREQARIAITEVSDEAGVAAKVFGALAQNNISVDTIIQSQRCRRSDDGRLTRDIAFTLARSNANAASAAIETLQSRLQFKEIQVDSQIAKVSVVGAGMLGQPGVAAKLFKAFSEAKINIQMIATSDIRVSCIVAETDGAEALKLAHAAFALGSSTPENIAT
ncbi:MAG: aspartate kinase [Cyanobacteria bacterium P01_H01_bin.15]